MAFSFRRLRRGHLVGLTLLYWAALGLVKLLHPILVGWRLTQLAPGRATISAGLTNALLHVTMTQDGSVVWAGQASLPVIFGWIVGPPLLLFAAWKATRDAEPIEAAAPSALGSGTDPALPAPSLEDRLGAAERDAALRPRSSPGGR